MTQLSTLVFNTTTLKPIDMQDGQLWISSSDIASALGYKNTRSITNLYNANSDEFREGTTEVIESVTSLENKGLTQKTRVFSLRGCHLIGFFARTKVAKDFRVWVLDILDREIQANQQTQIPTFPKMERYDKQYHNISHTLRNVINQIATCYVDKDQARIMMHRKVCDACGVGDISWIDEQRMSLALYTLAQINVQATLHSQVLRKIDNDAIAVLQHKPNVIQRLPSSHNSIACHQVWSEVSHG